MDVTDRAHVRGQIQIRPAAAGEDEAPVRKAPHRLEEELPHPLLAVRQPVADESEIDGEAGVRRDRVMGRWIERVVDWYAGAGAEPAVGLDHRVPAAVGEDQVVA
jgi:hypothetical protein